MLHLGKVYDIITASFQERRKAMAVETHKARQRTNVYISARVLEQAFGLHLGQSVKCGVATKGKLALQLSLESKAHT